MGGIGKTTIARLVYESISVHFEVSCFLANVREVSERGNLVDLQRQLLSPILKEQITQVWDEQQQTKLEASPYEGRRLKRQIGIRGISLRRATIEKTNWNCEAFSKMLNPKFLEFDNMMISTSPRLLPNSLRSIKWSLYPSKFLPSRLSTEVPYFT
ncbi:unnamed protein product [Prunus brigantina]